MRFARAILIAVLLPACGPRPATCQDSSDCPSGLTCSRYFCLPMDGGTSEEYFFVEEDGGTEPDGGEEIPDAGDAPDGGLQACSAHADCAAPLKCRGHVCR